MNTFPADVRRHFEMISRLEMQIENKITELNVSSGPLTEITRINNSINYLLKQYDSLISEGYELAHEQDDGNIEKQMEKKLDKLKINYKEHKLNLIKANQKAKQQMNLEILKEREELFKDSKGQNVKNKKRGNNKSLLKGNEELTDSLRQAVQMLNEEVQKSSQNSKLLDDSTSTLSKTSEEYKKYGYALDSNKKVVQNLKRRDLTDKILLTLGLLFFLSTVFYVIGKRIWIPKILFSKKGASAVASSIKNAVKSTKIAKASLTTTTTLASSATKSSVTTTIASATKTIIKTIVDEL